jgi:AcrR family transcriptional regulator
MVYSTTPLAQINTPLYGCSMPDRLSAEAWIDHALVTLAREGSEALKADVLARRLGVSRGSFYWHFADLASFHGQVIRHWKQRATEAIIADIEQHASHEARLDALLRHAFGHGNTVEIRMRSWAGSSVDAARAVGEIDDRRREYLERLLTEAGVPVNAAQTRAQLLYWTYLGAALSRGKLAGERLNEFVTELKRIGLGRKS